METTFRINYAPASETRFTGYESMFVKLGRMLCDECAETCKGFFLTDSAEAYQAHAGPKIGWAVEGTQVLLRMANCKQLHRLEHISQLLKLFDMDVVESKLVH